MSEQEFLDAFSEIFSAKVDSNTKVSVSATAAVSTNNIRLISEVLLDLIALVQTFSTLLISLINIQFNEFVAADSLEAIMNRFSELKEALNYNVGDDIYTLLKNQTKSDARVNVLWRLLDTKKAKVRSI